MFRHHVLRRRRRRSGHRDDLVITTKCFNPTGEDVNARGTSRRHVIRALEASLKRLQTDRVEVFFLHHYDKRTPLEQLQDSLNAVKIDMTPALRDEITALSRTPAPATDRLEELKAPKA